MKDIDVVNHIKELLKNKKWSNYKLSQVSGLSREGINKMLRENHIPSIYSLIKICNGFDISLSQFFAEIETPDDEIIELLTLWNMLNLEDKKLVKIYMYGLTHKKITINNTIERSDKNEF